MFNEFVGNMIEFFLNDILFSDMFFYNVVLVIFELIGFMVFFFDISVIIVIFLIRKLC